MKVRDESAVNQRVLTRGHLQSLIPVVMSGIIAVYGLVVSVLIAGSRTCLLHLSTQTRS